MSQAEGQILMRALIGSERDKHGGVVDWNPVARAALRTILDFISERNVFAAQDLYDAIATATKW